MNVRINSTGLIAALAVFSFGSVAAAQDWESGDTGAWGTPPPDQQQQQQQQQQQPQQQQPQQQQWQQGQQPQQQGWQQQQQQQPAQQEQPPGWGDTEQPPAASEDDGATDHSLVVGHLGATYFGVSGVQLAASDPLLGGEFSVSAPTVGIRYWLSEGIGLDIGLGFGYRSDSGESDTPGGVESNDISSALAMVIHGGLPIALYAGKHYKFLLIPELNIAFASGTTFGGDPSGFADHEYTAFRLDLGGRVGTEIQFGFIDIPELSVQGSVGLNLSYVRSTHEYDFPDSTIDTNDSFRLGTTLQNEPWDLFTASIAAVYYFR